jgi:hypothetical protein
MSGKQKSALFFGFFTNLRLNSGPAGVYQAIFVYYGSALLADSYLRKQNIFPTPAPSFRDRHFRTFTVYEYTAMSARRPARQSATAAQSRLKVSHKRYNVL